MAGWNLPPGCTGNEPQIAGQPKEDEAICDSCQFLDENGDCDPNRPDCPLTVRDLEGRLPPMRGNSLNP